MENLPRFMRVENSQSLIRDTFSMGVMNTDHVALEAAQRRRSDALNRFVEERRQRLELNNLRKEVDELKALVNQFLK